MVFKDSDNYEIYIKGSKTELKNGWILYKWAIPSSDKKLIRATNYITTSTGLSTQETTYLGGCFISMYKTGFLPCINHLPVRAILTTQPTAGIWDVGDIVIDSTGTSIGWICTVAPSTFISLGTNTNS
jgi:hypothetical protein